MKTKHKEKKILKVAREKRCTSYRERTIWMIEDFSSENMEPKRSGTVFRCWKNNCQNQISISSENTLHQWRQNKDILKMWKTKRTHHQQISSERTANGSPLDRGKWYQRETWNFKDDGWATEIVNIRKNYKQNYYIIWEFCFWVCEYHKINKV